MRSHFFDGRQIVLAAIQPVSLQSIKGVILAETARQVAKHKHVAASSVNAVKGRLISSRLNGDQARPGGRPTTPTKDVRQFFHRRCLKQSGQRESPTGQLS